MIVVDTNVIAYLFGEGPQKQQALLLRTLDSDWRAPRLWRSEFMSVMHAQIRRHKMTHEAAKAAWGLAQKHMANAEVEIDHPTALALAIDRGCTTYDCEFVAAAQQLGVHLVTADQHVLARFPAVAQSLAAATGAPA